jgi:hypothetical protein
MAKRTNGTNGGNNGTHVSPPPKPTPRSPMPPQQRPGPQRPSTTLQVTARGTARRVPPGPPQRQALPDPIEGIFADDGGMGMGPSEDERLAAWIEDLYSSGPVARLELQQVISGGAGGAPVRDWAAELSDLGDPQGIASEIMAAAHEDTESSGQFSRYVVCATRPGAAAYFRRFFFSIQAPPVDQAGFASEYGAEGLVSQAHRHVEQIMRIGLGSAAASLRSIISQNHELAGLARTAWTAQAEAARAREQLLDRSMERDLLMQRQAGAQARRDRTTKWAEALIGTLGLPALLHHVGAPPAVVAQAAAIGREITGIGGVAAAAVTGTRPTPGAPVGLGDLSPAEASQLDAVCMAIAVDLAKLDDATWQIAAGMLPADACGPLRRARAVIAEAVDEDRTKLTVEEGMIILATRPHITNLMSTLDDVQFSMLLAQTSEANREPLSQFRARIRARTAQAPSPPTPPAAPPVGATQATGAAT